jgi:hypothetical protein
MRGVRFAACLAALSCCACSSLAPVAPRVEYVSAYGQPAGYYPGRAQADAISPELAAWLAKNKSGIDDVQDRVVQIREGRRPPGCIGEDKYTCVATLAQKLAITDSYVVKDNLFAEVRYDVNGRPLIGKITFEGYLPNAKGGDFIYKRTAFLLTLGPQGTITTIEVSLPKDPIYARTQDEYDATAAYETVSALTAKTCPTLARADVARWIENTIKPKSKEGPRKRWSDLERGHATSITSPKTAFCGRTFQFESVQGSVQRGFQHQSFGGMNITVE